MLVPQLELVLPQPLPLALPPLERHPLPFSLWYQWAPKVHWFLLGLAGQRKVGASSPYSHLLPSLAQFCPSHHQEPLSCLTGPEMVTAPLLLILGHHTALTSPTPYLYLCKWSLCWYSCLERCSFEWVVCSWWDSNLILCSGWLLLCLLYYLLSLQASLLSDSHMAYSLLSNVSFVGAGIYLWPMPYSSPQVSNMNDTQHMNKYLLNEWTSQWENLSFHFHWKILPNNIIHLLTD